MHQSIEPVETTFIGDRDNPGETQTKRNNIDQSITFVLVSLSPYMNSTMTVTIKESPEYSQILIHCSNGSTATSEFDMAIIYITPQGSVIMISCYQEYINKSV